MQRGTQWGEGVTASTWVSPHGLELFFSRWLRPVHRQLGEGNEEFALRVQQVVSAPGRVEVVSLLREKGKKASDLNAANSL